MSLQLPPTPISAHAMADLLCSFIVLCRGFNADQQPIWAYLCIKPSMAADFKEARERGNIDIAEFGTVLESGMGKEPPEDTKQLMERDYGVNHAFEEEILNALSEARQAEMLS